MVRLRWSFMKIALFISFLALVLFTSCARATHDANDTRSQKLAGDSAAAFNAKDYAKAQSLAEQATSVKPQFAEAWVEYGMASAQLGQTNRDREGYEHALALFQARRGQNPSDANQFIQQIFVLSLLGRNAEAAILLKQTRTEYPNDRSIAGLARNFDELKQDWGKMTVNAK